MPPTALPRPAPIVLLLVLLLLGAMGALAQAAVLRVGYVSGVEPSKAGIAEGRYERDLHAPIDWRRFDNGSEVLRALASRDLDIGNIGSSVVAVATSQGLPIETFLIASELGTSEGLIARAGSGIRMPADLRGHTIAVPFVTTAHYSLLAALKHWGIPATSVRIVNLRISEIPAAWQGGHIDAAYAFDPALGRIRPGAQVLATSADVARWGSPTFDVWVVRRDFGSEHPELVSGFVRTALAYFADYRRDPQRFAADPQHLSSLARATGASAEDVPALLAGNQYPLLEEQRSLLSGVYVRALADTAAFLKDQGKLGSLASDYHGAATVRFLPPAAATAAP